MDVDAACNVTLEVSDEDIAPSLEHLKSVGFVFEKGEMPDSEILPSMMNGVE